MHLTSENLIYRFYQGKHGESGTCYHRETKRWYRPIEKKLAKLAKFIYSYRRKRMPHYKCYSGMIGRMMWCLSEPHQLDFWKFKWIKKL